MTTLAQPHVNEAPSRRALLKATRFLGCIGLSLAIASLAALGARWLVAAGLPLAPRVMVPL